MSSQQSLDKIAVIFEVAGQNGIYVLDVELPAGCMLDNDGKVQSLFDDDDRYKLTYHILKDIIRQLSPEAEDESELDFIAADITLHVAFPGPAPFTFDWRFG